MASAPDLRACHPSNPLPCDKFLSVRELEARLQYLHVPDVEEIGVTRA